MTISFDQQFSHSIFVLIDVALELLLAPARKCLSPYLLGLAIVSKDFKRSSLKGNHQPAT